MKKILLIVAMFFTSVLTVQAATMPWDYTAGVIQPAQTAWNALLRVGSVTASSTATSTFAGAVAIGTTSATHALTFPANSSGIALYNTTDQTTNYERVTNGWSGNAYTITSNNAGSGISRDVFIGAGGVNSANAIGVLFSPVTASPAKIQINAQPTGSGNAINAKVTWTGSTGNPYLIGLTPTITQTGTAGYAALLISPTETTVGTGIKNLIQAGTSTNQSMFVVNNVGNVGVATTSSVSPFEVWSGGLKKFTVQSTGRNILVGNINGGSIDLANTSNNINVSSSMFQFNTNQVQGYNFAGGNVGIGTTTPGSVLTVVGSTTITGTTTLATTTITSLSIGTLSGILKATAGAIGTSLVSLATDITGFLGVANGGTGTTTVPTLGQVLVGQSNGTYAPQSTSTLGFGSATSSVLAGTDGQFAVYAGTGTTVSGTSLLTYASSTGFIGIGTTTPSDLLTVVGGNVTGIEMKSSNSGFLGVGKITADRWRMQNDFTSPGTLEFLYNAGTGGVPATNLLTLTGSTSGIAGRVGIGTTSPVSILAVTGTTTTLGLRIYGLPGTRALFLDAAGNATSTVASASLTSALSDETGTGVAVFATSPTITTPIIATIAGGTGTSSALNLKSTTGAGTGDLITFLLGTNGAREAGRILTNGFWGLGSSTPSSQFVVGSTTATSSYMSFSPNGTSTLTIMGTSTIGSQIIMKDSAGTGCTKLTTNAGVLIAAVVTCP